MTIACQSLKDALLTSLKAARKFNRSAQIQPAAVLWTDAERQWSTVISKLRSYDLDILSLGNYSPSEYSGPAIWLKCALAGLLEGIRHNDAPPIIYLPGVSRIDLRAIESCPRELQPLAELQYRGVFWSQINAKDWTINAFLSSKNGGLGLDISQDRATQAALQRAFDAGVLLDRTMDELKSQQINASWLDSLLAPNPTRDILVWLNNPEQAKTQWDNGHRDVFINRCRKDFHFDPMSDGILIAAEKLASRTAPWSAVWELYQDSFTSFPAVAEQLARVQPPVPSDLFSDVNELAGYPRANDDAEASLRSQLENVGTMGVPQARAAIAECEKNHGHRRLWLWARMGRAPLAQALEHVATVAKLTTDVPGGPTPEQMAVKYKESGWQVDAAAMKAIATVQTKADTDAVTSALKAVYVPWLEDTANRFQEVAKTQGGLNGNLPKKSPNSDGLCTVFVDGLRYDVAVELKEKLDAIGKTSLDSTWTTIPSVTASGKAWASPVADAVAGKKTDEEFQPSVAEDGKPLNTYNLRKLLETRGIQVLGKNETGEPTGKAWVECGDLDHYGHEHGLRLARDLDNQLEKIVERITELKEAGWSQFRIVTDHGWLLVPGGLPKAELSKHETQTRWGRCAVLKDLSYGTPLTFGWDWCKDVQLAMAPGISSFIAGAEYAHGGLTLQECLVPVLEVKTTQKAVASLKVDILKVTWKGLRCQVEVSRVQASLKVDIRTKAAQSDSSLAANVKPVEDDRASLAIADDSYIGSAAFVVILDAAGEVVQKAATTVGE